MDNNELLNQIASLLETQTEVLDKRFQKIDERLTNVEDLARSTAVELRKTQIMIENDVAKRIDALFDGYKLTHEKQWELENQNRQLQLQIDDLQVRVAALESNSAS